MLALCMGLQNVFYVEYRNITEREVFLYTRWSAGTLDIAYI